LHIDRVLIRVRATVVIQIKIPLSSWLPIALGGRCSAMSYGLKDFAELMRHLCGPRWQPCIRLWKGSYVINVNNLYPITIKAPDGNMGLVTYGVYDDRNWPTMGISDGVASPCSAVNFLSDLDAKLGGRMAMHGHPASMTMYSYSSSSSL